MTKISGSLPTPQNLRATQTAPPVAPAPPSSAAMPKLPALPSTSFVGGVVNPFTPRLDTPMTPAKLERPARPTPQPQVSASREFAMPAARTSAIAPIAEGKPDVAYDGAFVGSTSIIASPSTSLSRLPLSGTPSRRSPTSSTRPSTRMATGSSISTMRRSSQPRSASRFSPERSRPRRPFQTVAQQAAKTVQSGVSKAATTVTNFVKNLKFF